MEKVALLSDVERRELFQETAVRKAMSAAIVEKDFWVCWALKRIYQDTALSERLMFKGGTSLSKVFHVIERFSEDIDLILDWRIVAPDNPLEARSKTQQQKLNKKINKQAQQYIARELFDMLSKVVSPICNCELDTADRFVVNVRYPASFSDEYLRPEVRLEIGPLASWLPFDSYSIEPYAAEAFPDVFAERECSVKAIKAERTFWEKVTILHHEAYRPEGSIQPARYSRHYYDLYRMAKSDIKERALAELTLLADVVQFKDCFYPSAWAHYDLAKPGTLKLVPEAHILRPLQKDYRNMNTMIFGEYPGFNDVMSEIALLEQEINALEES